MLRLLRSLLALSLLPSLSLSAKPDALPPPVVPQCFGVNIHFTGQPTQDLDGIARGGFGWVRMDFAWAAIEKTKGVYDFAAYDSLLAGLTARHVKPLFILDYGNDLYQKDSPRTPEARAAFARFAAAAARHYRGRTVLWEIWNEPNIGFWKPQPDVREYGALALAAAHAVHAADPNATVIAPGSSTLPMGFMEGLFRQGLLGQVDAVSFHPYRGSAPETAGDDYQNLRRLIRRYAPPGKDVPLVSSEWGYSTVGITEQRQAQFLVRQWLSNLAEGIRLSIWYDWHDDGTDPNNGEDNFGTVHGDYMPKPSFLAAQTLTRTLGGFRFLKRIPLTSPGDYLLLFGKGPDALKLVAWTTGSDHAILLPVTAVAAVTGMTGDAVPAMPSAGRLPLTLTGSPVYLNVTGDAALRQAGAWAATPRSPFYAAREPLRLALTYRNPDAFPHRLRFIALLTTPDGTRTPILTGDDIVAPFQRLDVGLQAPALAGATAQVRVGLVIDGKRQPYPQDVAFAPLAPFILTVMPTEDGKVQVRIDDLSGVAFTGRLTTAGPGGVTSVPVILRTGQTSATVTVPIKPAGGAAWRLRDEQGRLAAALTAPRPVP